MGAPRKFLLAETVQSQFLLQQWHEIEEMLEETRALDTGIPTIE
jgi:hypothetical protein